jgi:hypothetical protein
VTGFLWQAVNIGERENSVSVAARHLVMSPCSSSGNPPAVNRCVIVLFDRNFRSHLYSRSTQARVCVVERRYKRFRKPATVVLRSIFEMMFYLFTLQTASRSEKNYQCQLAGR